MSRPSGESAGYVTSAFHSPGLGTNIALAMLPVDLTRPGTELRVGKPGDGDVAAEVCRTPFRDPDKEIPRQ